MTNPLPYVVVILSQVYCAALTLGVLNYRAFIATGYAEPVSFPARPINQPPVQSWVLVAAFAVGAMTAGRGCHPFRLLGLLPPALVGVAATLLYCTRTNWEAVWPMAPLGFGLGVVLATGVRFERDPDHRRLWLLFVPGYALVVPGIVVLYATLTFRSRHPMYGPDPWRQYIDPFGRPNGYNNIPWPALAFAGLALALISLVVFRRPVVELLFKLLSLPFYRVRTVGPGAAAVPTRGPCLVVSNHAAYLDPLFIGNFVPRPVTPMMTSLFYDKPGIRLLMRTVFDDTIRVPETAMKRDTAEITAAVAALDAGKCVVIFPEGYLRRREDQPLRRFGRGVWEILRARPDTPVVACWIEGGWGSFFSFKGGPPTRNKRMDFFRRIGVGVSAPERVPADVLADHIATRFRLMNMVQAARKPLGLPELPVVEVPTRDDGV